MDVVTALFVQGDTGGKVQRVALFLAACAQQHAGRTDLFRIVGHNVAVLLGQQFVAGGGLCKQAVIIQHPDVAALRGKHFLALGKGRAVRNDSLGHSAAVGGIALACQHQHIGRQLQTHLGQVCRAVAFEHVHALHHFQTVADVVPQRGVHIGDHGSYPAAMVGADGNHQLRQLNALVNSFHKSTGAGGDVQQDGVRTRGQLFGHDAGRNQRDAADGSGNVPQSVHLFIRHSDTLALADDRQTDLVHLCKKLLLREGSFCAGHAFHFINGAAGVAETPAAHFGDLHPAGRHDGRNDQRGLITHAAGGVLVHLDARNGRKVYHHTAVRHHIGQLSGLLIGHAAQIHRHHPCGHLVVSHFPADKTVDNSFQLLPGVGAAIPLFCDQIINTHRFTLLFLLFLGRFMPGSPAIRSCRPAWKRPLPDIRRWSGRWCRSTA